MNCRAVWQKLGLVLVAGCLWGLSRPVLAQAPVALSLDPGRILADALALLGPAAKTPPPARSLRLGAGDPVAFMGDSITAAGGYLRLTAYVLQTQYPKLKLPPFINAGVGGQKAEDMVVRFAKDMKLAEKPAWVFINVGINDVWHRVKEAERPEVLAAYQVNVTRMVTQAQAAGATVALLTPTVIQERPEAEGNQRLGRYVAAMKDIAAEQHCLVVDLHAMFLMALIHKPGTISLTSDGVHMSAYGDALMAIGVLRAVGVPDPAIAAVDTAPAVTLHGLSLSVTKAADLLGVPPSRFSRPAFAQSFGF